MGERKPREDEMRLRALWLDRIGPLSAPLVTAVLLFGSPSFAPMPIGIGIGREFALVNQARAISSSVSRLR
jgi:hypothetical protein